MTKQPNTILDWLMFAQTKRPKPHTKMDSETEFSSDTDYGKGKEMLYLTTYSTHFIYGYMASDIWLRTILIVRKETRCRHIGYFLRLTAKVFYMHHPTDRIAHTTAFVTPVVEYWLEREIAQWVHHMNDRSDDPSHHEGTVVCVILSVGWCI